MRSGLLAAIACSCVVLTHAAQQTPIFRTGTNLVQVDAIVTGPDGQPLLDLSADDFALFDDGKRMAIRSVRLLGVGGENLKGPFAPIRTRDDELREASRDGVRVFAILLDDYHVRRMQELRIVPALLAFVKSLPASDLVGVYGLFDSVNDAHLTRDREPALNAISAFYGRRGDYTPKYPVEETHLRYPDRIEQIRLDITRGAIAALSMHLGGLTDGRKTLILVSEGFFLDESDARDVSWTANQANVAIYPIDPRGLMPPAVDASSFDRLPQVSGAQGDLFRRFATETGGRAIVAMNDLAGGLAGAARDSSAYYLIAYESPHPDDGKFHKIRVETPRKRASVRARAGYRAYKETERTTAAPAAPVTPEIARAMRELTKATRPEASDSADHGEREDETAAQGLLGAPTLAMAQGRELGSLETRREFPRAGVLVFRASVRGQPVVAARLLSRDGARLTELPAVLRDDMCEARLTLAALGQGDYIVEMTAQLGDEVGRQYVAFRVTR